MLQVLGDLQMPGQSLEMVHAVPIGFPIMRQSTTISLLASRRTTWCFTKT